MIVMQEVQKFIIKHAIDATYAVQDFLGRHTQAARDALQLLENVKTANPKVCFNKLKQSSADQLLPQLICGLVYLITGDCDQ